MMRRLAMNSPVLALSHGPESRVAADRASRRWPLPPAAATPERDAPPVVRSPVPPKGAMPGRLDGSRSLGMDLQHRPHAKRVDRRGGGDPEDAIKRLRRQPDPLRRHVVVPQGL